MGTEQRDRALPLWSTARRRWRSEAGEVAISLTILVLGSALLAWLSRRSLTSPRAHGFYRFFAWELMLALFCLNWPHWFEQPFATRQIVSWLLLGGSIPLAVEGARLLERSGGAQRLARDTEPALLGFERTTSLVTTGVYRYIRHPLYASLLALTWGMLLKHPSALALTLALGATILLFVTAKRDEAECRQYFGEEYINYMARTWLFVPFVI